MKKLIQKLLFFISLTLLFTACSRVDVSSPDITSTYDSPASSESPVSTNAVPTHNPSDVITPSSLPPLPLNIIFSEYVFNDDSKKIYIKTNYIDSSKFEKNSIGFNLALIVESDTNAFDEWLRKAADEYPATEDNYVSYGLTSIPAITENSSEYFSMYMDFYTYSGGAHGNVERYAYTFKKEGNLINDFTELLKSGVDSTTVEAEINRQIKARIDGGDPVFYNDSVSFSHPNEYPSFFIRNGTLVLYYQTYDIAPYVIGIPEFEMPPSIF